VPSCQSQQVWGEVSLKHNYNAVLPIVGRAYPPIPTVNDLSSQSRPSIIGISRPMKLPGPSKISCVWPWSAAACECDALSCEWLCDMMQECYTIKNGGICAEFDGLNAISRLQHVGRSEP
jgi:hypothetical protein